MRLRLIVAFVCGLLAARSLAADVLILRDGTRRQGTIAGCRDECTLDGEKVARSTIVWVGLGAGGTAPPPPRNPGSDEVHLVSGRIVVGEFGGMSLGAVLIGEDSFDRDEVAWLRFAGPEPAPTPTPTPPGPPAVVVPEGRPTGSSGTPAGQPVPPPRPAPAPRPTPPLPTPAPPAQPERPPSGRGERGALWTGTIIGRDYGNVDGVDTEISYTIDVKLREYRYPMECLLVDASGRATAPRAGTQVHFASEGSRITMRYTATSPWGTGSGQGETTVTSPPNVGGDLGAIWTKSVDRDLSGCLGADIPLGRSVYMLGIAGRGATYTVRWSNGSEGQMDFATSVIGRSPSMPATPCSDNEVRLLEGGGRMAGRFTVPCTGCCPTAEMAWSICREGVACPPPPPSSGPGAAPPSPSPAPCDETREDRAQLELLMDQWRAYAGLVKQSTAEFDALQRKASQAKGDFEQAMRDCNLWGLAQLLVSLLTSGAVEGQPEGFNAFVTYGSQLDKIASGDPSWLLPSYNVRIRGQQWTSLETAWDTFNYGYANLGASAPQQLIDRLRGCGAPTLEGVLDGAYEYLHLMEELKPLADRMHERENRLHDQEEKIFDFCLRNPKVCEDYDRCREQR